MAKPLTSRLVPSFSQHNLCLVVSGRCLHVSVMKFQDKFARLRQVNSPYSWNKFQICRTDMYLIRFLPNFAVFFVFLWISQDFADLPESRGSVTARNIRSPVTASLNFVLMLRFQAHVTCPNFYLKWVSRIHKCVIRQQEHWTTYQGCALRDIFLS